jgi:hypothetical protein
VRTSEGGDGGLAVSLARRGVMMRAIREVERVRVRPL